MVSPYLTKPKRSEAEVRAIRNAARAFVHDHRVWAEKALNGDHVCRTFARGYWRGWFFSELARTAP